MGRKGKRAGRSGGDGAELAVALLDLTSRIDSIVGRLSQRPEAAEDGGVRDAMRGLRRRLARLDDVVARVEADGGRGSASPPPDTARITESQREALTDLHERLTAVQAVVAAGAVSLPPSEARTEWESVVVRSIEPVVAEMQRLLGGDGTGGGAATAVLGQWTAAAVRDLVITLGDAIDAGIAELDGPASITETVDETCRLAELHRFAPVGGDRVDPARHEFEPTGRPSPHPRGTVARVVRHGYEWNGQVVRRARIELSAGG